MPNFDSRDPIKCGGVEALMEIASTTGNIPEFASTGQLADSGLAKAKLAQVMGTNDLLERSTNGACLVSGVTMVAGGTGLNGLTLAAPVAGARARIILESITSGDVVLKTPAGVTFDGTNNTATFNAAADELELIYKSATQWKVIKNTSVTLSST